jgi:pyruvate/2-oxoglutarate dehydrogenase complex dihydrolipoamide acyltransferase (E2) component
VAEIAVMPRLGVTMTEGTILAWLKEVGDEVEIGEPLFEVQTDKVNMEVESLFGGVVLERVAEVGQVLPVGAPVAVIGKPGEAYDRASLLPGKRGEQRVC